MGTPDPRLAKETNVIIDTEAKGDWEVVQVSVQSGKECGTLIYGVTENYARFFAASTGSFAYSARAQKMTEVPQ